MASTDPSGEERTPRAKKRNGFSKYDTVKVKVWLGDNLDHHYVLSRFLISRMLSVTRIPYLKAAKIALEVKKYFVDHNCLDVSQADFEAVLFHMMTSKGFGDYISSYKQVTQFFAQRQPLIILICGTSCTGKSILAQQLAARMNLPNVMCTDIVYQVLQSSDESPVHPVPLHKRDDLTDEQLVQEFRRECRIVRKGLDGDLTKAVNEGKPIIIEGLHLDPGLLLSDLHSQGVIVLPEQQEQSAQDAEGRGGNIWEDADQHERLISLMSQGSIVYVGRSRSINVSALQQQRERLVRAVQEAHDAVEAGVKLDLPMRSHWSLPDLLAPFEREEGGNGEATVKAGQAEDDGSAAREASEATLSQPHLASGPPPAPSQTHGGKSNAPLLPPSLARNEPASPANAVPCRNSDKGALDGEAAVVTTRKGYVTLFTPFQLAREEDGVCSADVVLAEEENCFSPEAEGLCEDGVCGAGDVLAEEENCINSEPKGLCVQEGEEGAEDELAEEDNCHSPEPNEMCEEEGVCEAEGVLVEEEIYISPEPKDLSNDEGVGGSESVLAGKHSLTPQQDLRPSFSSSVKLEQHESALNTTSSSSVRIPFIQQSHSSQEVIRVTDAGDRADDGVPHSTCEGPCGMTHQGAPGSTSDLTYVELEGGTRRQVVKEPSRVRHNDMPGCALGSMHDVKHTNDEGSRVDAGKETGRSSRQAWVGGGIGDMLHETSRLDVATSHVLDTDFVLGLDTDVTGKLDTSISQELDADMSHELDTDMSHEPDIDISHELDADISRELDTDISHELDADISRELDTDISHELDTDVSHELDTDVSGELGTDISQSLNTLDDLHALDAAPSHVLRKADKDSWKGMCIQPSIPRTEVGADVNAEVNIGEFNGAGTGSRGSDPDGAETGSRGDHMKDYTRLTRVNQQGGVSSIRQDSRCGSAAHLDGNTSSTESDRGGGRTLCRAGHDGGVNVSGQRRMEIQVEGGVSDLAGQGGRVHGCLWDESSEVGMDSRDKYCQRQAGHVSSTSGHPALHSESDHTSNRFNFNEKHDLFWEGDRVVEVREVRQEGESQEGLPMGWNSSCAAGATCHSLLGVECTVQSAQGESHLRQDEGREECTGTESSVEKRVPAVPAPSTRGTLRNGLGSCAEGNLRHGAGHPATTKMQNNLVRAAGRIGPLENPCEPKHATLNQAPAPSVSAYPTSLPFPMSTPTHPMPVSSTRVTPASALTLALSPPVTTRSSHAPTHPPGAAGGPSETPPAHITPPRHTQPQEASELDFLSTHTGTQAGPDVSGSDQQMRDKMADKTREKLRDKVPGQPGDLTLPSLAEATVTQPATATHRPVALFVPILINVNETDHKLILQEHQGAWGDVLYEGGDSGATPASTTRAELRRMRVLQDYLSMYKQSGLPMVDVKYGDMSDALEYMHAYVLQCIQMATHTV